MAVTFETVRQMALSLDNVEEGTSYGTPAFKVGGVLFARLREDPLTRLKCAGFGDDANWISRTASEGSRESFYILAVLGAGRQYFVGRNSAPVRVVMQVAVGLRDFRVSCASLPLPARARRPRLHWRAAPLIQEGTFGKSLLSSL